MLHIADFLGIGPDKAWTARSMAEFFGTSYRRITQAIERERRNGAPICAKSEGETRGFYLAADEDELRQYCRRLRRREAEIRKTRQALEKIIM